MREIRALTERVRAVFERAGYGEVYTPALEYERTFAHEGAETNPGYRVFDDHGNVLVLRSDMTVPIARVVGNRYAEAELPLRFCYLAHAYRAVRPRSGQSREFLQAGVELIGAPGAQGTAEALSVLCDALRAAGLADFRVGLGDVGLYPSLLSHFGVAPERSGTLLGELAVGNFVGVERELARLQLGPEATELLLEVPRMRGGPELLADLTGPLEQAGMGMRDVLGRLSPETAARVIFDFGLVRSLDYYTGAIFQVYDPGHGQSLGGGGRYDGLLAEFGRPLPAVGFALDVERVHIALTGEERYRG